MHCSKHTSTGPPSPLLTCLAPPRLLHPRTPAPPPTFNPNLQRYLSEDLDAWESFGGSHNGKGARICPAPYALQATAGRPIMLDTAAAGVEYPSLQHRMRTKAEAGAAGSTFARLTSWWGASS
jgi:hypothetical protein